MVALNFGPSQCASLLAWWLSCAECCAERAVLRGREDSARDMKVEEPTTQRALEVHLRARWADRLLAHFAPTAIMGPAFRQEMGHLLRHARFRTLRHHCLAYKGIRKRGFTAIPWREIDVRNLLNTLAAEEVTPYKLQQVWNTLKWLSKVFGVLNLTGCTD